MNQEKVGECWKVNETYWSWKIALVDLQYFDVVLFFMPSPVTTRHRWRRHCFRAARPPRSYRQILLPRHLMNGLSNRDETYREYSLLLLMTWLASGGSRSRSHSQQAIDVTKAFTSTLVEFHSGDFMGKLRECHIISFWGNRHCALDALVRSLDDVMQLRSRINLACILNNFYRSLAYPRV